MCIKKALREVFILILISGAVITSGCTGNAQISHNGSEFSAQTSIENSLNTEYELEFMKYILSEMKSQGKNITLPLEIYRIARLQAKSGDTGGFKESVDLFYEQSNSLMAGGCKLKICNLSEPEA
ncbi:MAG: hypothetical protein PHP13_06155 [Methanomicrobium sp.]|nr:hypothetical protein [Methanomicrobium sp.]MDD4299279.1 hypothetical protein [Methanomicrobium sp.]